VTGELITAGECLAFSSELGWVSELIVEGAGSGLGAGAGGASVSVHVEATSNPFDTAGWELVARGMRRRGPEAVFENVCTAGFDLHLRVSDDRPVFTYRWRPPTRDRVASRVLRSRFHLLARAALLQYPALWWSGLRDRAPLHASACAAGGSIALVTAQSGVGRSTLVAAAAVAGAASTGDNIAVGDGTALWGLTEPARVKTTGPGRKMPHGRHEILLPNRVPELEPDCVVVLVRGAGEQPLLRACSTEAAADALVSSTYMAGELRRYWGLAAALSTATGTGRPHPPVVQVATAFAERLPCFTLELGATPGASLGDLLEPALVAA
jgi:hypothetical protein